MTPDHGPRVWWVTVLSDAPLSLTGEPMKQRCGECTACVDVCPVQAFTGEPFLSDEPREARFDAAACEQNFRELEKDGGADVCGLCLYVYPYGKKQSKSVGKRCNISQFRRSV